MALQVREKNVFLRGGELFKKLNSLHHKKQKKSFLLSSHSATDFKFAERERDALRHYCYLVLVWLHPCLQHPLFDTVALIPGVTLQIKHFIEKDKWLWEQIDFAGCNTSAH